MMREMVPEKALRIVPEKVPKKSSPKLDAAAPVEQGRGPMARTWLNRSAIVSLVSLLAVLLVASMPSTSAQAGGKRDLPARYSKYPLTVKSLSVGHPNDGWQLRGPQLRNTKYLRVRKKSRKIAYGHPALLLMLKNTAKEIAKVMPGSVLLVGDLSAKKGGPLKGHASHQSGRDADVGFYVKKKGLRVNSKSFRRFRSDGIAKDGSRYTFDDRRNWLLVRFWLTDGRAGISHVFVSRGLRKRLLAFANRVPTERKYAKRAAKFLKQPTDSGAHDDHFHVRISCPKNQKDICREHSARRPKPTPEQAALNAG